MNETASSRSSNSTSAPADDVAAPSARLKWRHRDLDPAEVLMLVLPRELVAHAREHIDSVRAEVEALLRKRLRQSADAD